MDEQLETWREVVVDDVLKQWDVDTSGSQVCDDEKVELLLSELLQSLFSGLLIHRTEDVRRLEASESGNLMQVLYMVPCGCEYYRLLDVLAFELDQLLHDEQECGNLLKRPQDQEVALQVI